jgi:uncharacterized protein (DUF1800 family)
MPSNPSHAVSPRGRLRLLPSVLVLVIPVLGSACGGGGGTVVTPPGGGGPPVDPATLLTAKASYDVADIRHFLARTHLAVRAADVAAVQQVGLPAYVAQMLQFPAPGVTTPEEAAADPILVNPTDPPGLQGGFPNQGQLAQWWQYLFQRNPNPFQEVLALFWHDHFAASNIGLEQDKTWWTKTHVNLWRDQGAGNLKTLGIAMARDWTMLMWLDGLQNTAAFPNENFGREFYELFFLGVDQGYTQADIVEAARAWTGYRERGNVVTNQSFVEFDFNRHDQGAKVIFGTTIPAQPSGAGETDDFDEMVDITFANRPVEAYIARKILEAFCYANPPDTVVTQLGALLRGGNWALAPVFTTLFLSEAFHSPTAKAGFVKSPVDHALSLIRSTGILAQNRTLNNGLQTLGHVPTQPPTVNGWPVADAWLSAQGMVDRANLGNAILVDRVTQQQNGFNLATLLPPLPATTAQIVDHLALMLNVTITASERALYVTYLDTTTAGAPSVFNPANATQIDQRLRGLLYVLTQHPTFAVR